MSGKGTAFASLRGGPRAPATTAHNCRFCHIGVARYTPIAVRVVKQGSADGLSVSTWWLKLTAYTFSNIYFFKNAYPVLNLV